MGVEKRGHRDVCEGRPFVYYRFMSTLCVLGLLKSRDVAFQKVHIIPIFTVQ